jgi:hypothetical protein
MGSPEVPCLEVPTCPSGFAVVPKITKPYSEPLKKNRKPCIGLSPRKMNLHYSMTRTLDSRWSCMQLRNKLETIKVTPNSLGRMFINRKLFVTFRTVEVRIFTVGNKYINLLLVNIKCN